MYQMVLMVRGERETVLDVKIIEKIIKSRREKYKNKLF